jgi:hypothetical protein
VESLLTWNNACDTSKKNVAVIKSNYATGEDVANLRADMHNLARQQIMWSVGTILSGMGIVFAILKWLAP